MIFNISKKDLSFGLLRKEIVARNCDRMNLCILGVNRNSVSLDKVYGICLVFHSMYVRNRKTGVKQEIRISSSTWDFCFPFLQPPFIYYCSDRYVYIQYRSCDSMKSSVMDTSVDKFGSIMLCRYQIPEFVTKCSLRSIVLLTFLNALGLSLRLNLKLWCFFHYNMKHIVRVLVA